MRTLDDLDAAFAALADTAPDAASVSLPKAGQPTKPAGRPIGLRPRRRGWIAPAAAALATAAVVGGVVAAMSGTGRQPSAHRSPSVLSGGQPSAAKIPATGLDPTFRFTADSPRAGLVPSYGIDRAGQILEFRTPPKTTPCHSEIPGVDCRRVAAVRLYLAEPSKDRDEANFAISKVTHRTPVRVAGHRGFYGRIAHATDPRDKLYWQYTPGTWAEATSSTPAAELALAESVRPAAIPVPVPLYPSPTRPGQYLNVLASELSRYGGDFEVTTPGARHGGFYVAWGLEVHDGDYPSGGSDAQHVSVGGRDWTIRDSNGLVATLDSSPLPLIVTGYTGTTRAQLIAVLRGLHLASDLTDRSTWFATSAAFS